MTSDPMDQFERALRLHNITLALQMTEDPADRLVLLEMRAEWVRERLSEIDAEVRA